MDIKVATELIIPERELGCRFSKEPGPAGNPLFRRFRRWESYREIKRVLKRYLARTIFRQLQQLTA